MFKNVAPPEPAEQLLVDALGELADEPLDEVRLLRYTPRGLATEGGDRGHQDTQSNEVAPGIRDQEPEEDLGAPETSAGGYAANPPDPSKPKARSKRTQITQVN